LLAFGLGRTPSALMKCPFSCGYARSRTRSCAYPGAGRARRAAVVFLAALSGSGWLGCTAHAHSDTGGFTADAAQTAGAGIDGGLAHGVPPGPPKTGLLHVRSLRNRIAYVPPQCFTNTRAKDGSAKNPCYACHTKSEAPNFVNDDELQLTLKLPLPAATNPWTNLLAPPVAHAAPMSDDAVLAYVRQSNYFDGEGQIPLAKKLAKPSADWDGNGNGRWDGFVPDVEFAFDDEGFDHRKDGTMTGWRAFAYYPFVGTFFPTNGSADDVMIRLDPALRQDSAGHDDTGIYKVNLAVVEALVTRADVAIDPVDETVFGVDLDLDGHLGRASRVAFDGGHGRSPEDTRMRYVGRAKDLQAAGRFPIAPGLFPQGTEFFHTVRYLDIGPDGGVTMAARMKEVRYARKVTFLGYGALKAHVDLETRVTETRPDRAHDVQWLRELGVSNGQGWLFQGFIEDADGSLRPQSIEESSFCEGCHGGIGATTDGIFSFPRKIGGDVPARGWFHWSQHGLSGVPEPKRKDGQYEYTLYLQETGAGDELRANDEVTARFFDDKGALRADEVAALHKDVTRLLLPTPARALALDRAYHAVVVEQSFDKGRDAVLAPSENVLASPVVGGKTGISRAIVAMRLAR
jgi:hypothetical protein